ncbi:MAG TPA: Ig-like domain-containing protein [Candidatus Paceibacterota bacterium]|nr:Ig-like domain-containing protein [Candidatus Paceibacterota bacterium]
MVLRRHYFLVPIFAALIFLSGVPSAFAATIYANSSTGSDTTGNGSSGNPYQTFTKAYSAASSGDTINLTGTFDWSNASETTSVTSGFTINKNITITGQSATSTIIQASSTPGTANRRVFSMASSNLTVTFENLTIQYGNVASNGGGVSIGASYGGNNITFQNCILNDNYATNGYGGAYYDYYSVGSNTFTMNDCTVEGNSAEGSSNEFGGGLQLSEGLSTITNSTFVGNSAKTTGSAISGYYGSMIVTNSTFTGNSQSDAFNDFYNSGSDTVILTNNTIAYNTASSTNDAGGVQTESGAAPLYLENNLIFGNTNPNGSADWDDGGATVVSSYNIVGSQINGTNFTNGTNHNIIGTSTTVNLSSTLANNSATNETQTLALSSGSAAIGAGTYTTNNTVSVPFTDQRGLYRNNPPGIGAYEYNAQVSENAPTVPASNVTFSSVTQTSMTASWTNGNGGLQVVFVAATSSPSAAASPVNNTTYTANGAFGSGTQIGSSGWYAVYKGTGTSVSISGLSASTTYDVQVVELNGNPGSEQYLSATSTGNPAAISTISYMTPTTPAKNVSFSSISGGSATISWTNGNGADSDVFIAATSSLSTAPAVNDTSYTPSTVFGSGTQIGTSGWYTVANGNGTSVTVSNLQYGQPYAVDVVEYNGTSGYQQYLTTATTTNPYLRSAYAGTTIYSNASTGNDSTGNGSSGNPYATFTKAYNTAVDGDTINLTGTFNWASAGETGDSAPNGFTLSKNIIITGQGASSTIVEASSTNTATERVFYIPSNVSISFQDLQMRYGNPGASNGGCLYSSTTGVLTFSYLDINTCKSTANGGGFYLANSGTTTIQNSSFHNIVTTTNYGAVDQTGSGNLFIVNSTFSGNYATTTNDTGAAFGSNNGHVWFINDTVTGNYSYQGALETGGTAAYFRNTIVAGNFATSSTIVDLYRGAGVITSEGNNIFGTFVPSSNIATTSTDWTNTSGNGTFIMYATSTTGTLSLGALTLDNNSGTYVAPLQASSIGINQGSGASFTVNNVTETPPTIDQRGLTRDSQPDIGAYEYDAMFDTTPPTVSLTAPIASEATSSVMTFSANASDNVAVAGVTFYLNGVKIDSEITSTPYMTTYDTTATSTGTYSAFAVARDTSSNYATSTSVSFTIDNTGPTVSVTAPTSSESTSTTVTLAASASDANTSVQGVTFYVDGAKQGSEVTNAPYTIYWDSTATSSGSHFVFAVARDILNNYSTSTSVTFTVANTGATPTLVAANPSVNGATISWQTATAASSRVSFGLSSSYSSSTPETDTSPRVTNHSVVISGLPACAQFHFAVYGQTTGMDTATSSDQTFKTAGCTGGASISATGQGTIATSTGGTLSQDNLSLSVPISFTSTSSSAIFQANELDTSSFFAGAGTPSGMNKASTPVFNLKAFVNAATTLTTFSSPLTVTLSYTPTDISGLQESTLWIYRYDGSNWYPLTDCVVDTSGHTVSCTTGNFSDFALFGQASPSQSSGTSEAVSGGTLPWCSGPSAPGWNNNLPGGGCHSQNPSDALVKNSTTTSNTVATPKVFRFTRNLERGMSGKDVQALQAWLNLHGFLVATSGSGSLGSETDYFGPATKKALTAFQVKNNIAPSVGYFGPITRKFVESLGDSNQVEN